MIKVLMFGVLGGLGLFLFGMKSMSEGIQKVAGKRLRRILEVLTKNRFLGVGVGALVTSIVQSSSTVTVMTVGFVNAGLLGLTQAVSVVLGANIGTTITAQIISFKISQYALPAIGIGVIMYLFAKKPKYKHIGQLLFGFGLIFLGLSTMKHSFVDLKSSESFKNLFVVFSHNPLLAVGAGALLTMIIQSSSATIGITIALASTGYIPFESAFPLVLGENIGTTITAQIASIGTNITARRAAMSHTLFNLIGTAYMLLLLFVKIDGVPVFLKFIDVITPGDVFNGGVNIERHIANAHSMFNIINTILFIPLIPFLAKVCTKIIPGEVEIVEGGSKYLDDRLLEIPSAAISNAKLETIRMSEFALKVVDTTLNGIYDKKKFKKEKIYQLEEVLDELQQDIIDYLIKINDLSLSDNEHHTVTMMMTLVHDLEKIGDHSVNIAQLIEQKNNNKLNFSDDAIDDITKIDKSLRELMSLSFGSYKEKDKDMAQKAELLENDIDKFKVKSKKAYIKRLAGKKEERTSGIVYAEIVNNLERIGDHTFKFAKHVLNKD